MVKRVVNDIVDNFTVFCRYRETLTMSNKKSFLTLTIANAKICYICSCANKTLFHYDISVDIVIRCDFLFIYLSLLWFLACGARRDNFSVRFVYIGYIAFQIISMNVCLIILFIMSHFVTIVDFVPYVVSEMM